MIATIGAWPYWVTKCGGVYYGITYNTGGWYKCGTLQRHDDYGHFTFDTYHGIRGFDAAMRWLGSFSNPAMEAA